jgi:lysophospholipase L1-like esterase/ubiquinone/menaquinone biosynthesis C-methylase UbiE
MLYYNNEGRVQVGGDIDEVYASNPNRFTHDTQTLYLKQLAQERIFQPNQNQQVTCLDIGCGQGALLDILYTILREEGTPGLAPNGFYGLDVSEVGIRQADKNYPQYNWIIDSFQEFCTQSAEKFDLDNSFSIILNRGGLTSLGSMDEYEDMLNYVNRLLSENGIYFFSQNTNYYRIWMNGMLKARPDPLKPVPSIFKMASTVFECIRFYRLPGDYIGVYRKRPSSASKSSAFIQQPTQREPFAVKLRMSNGKEPTLFVSGDDVAGCFLTKYTLSEQELKDFAFDVPPIYQEARMKTEQELSDLAKSINAGSNKPRYFISNFQMDSQTSRSIPLTMDFLKQETEEARFLYFPRRFLTICDLCRFYPEISKGLPDGIILGIGLQDDRFEEEIPHPLVDLGAYRNRLDWLFDTLLKDNIQPIWCLTRIEENRTVPNTKYFYLAHETEKFTQIEVDLCKKYKIPMVELRDLTTYSNNAKLKQEAATRLHAAIKSQPSTLSPNISEEETDQQPRGGIPYIMPFSGTLIFDDGTSQPLSTSDVRYLVHSTPYLIYALQLHNSAYDIKSINDPDFFFRTHYSLVYNPGFINGMDFFSRSCQTRHCMQMTQSRDESLPDVLILGDSIRMRIQDLTGYGQKATEGLAGQANILHIGENFGGSAEHSQVVNNIAASTMKPSIVHVNTGLHDVMRDRFSKKEYVSYNDIDTYAKNVQQIIRTLKSIPSVKVVIWATMTPIHPEWHNTKRDGAPQQYIRSQEDVIAYNARAVKIAREEGAQINDLYAAVQDAGLEKCILRDGVHLSDYGATIIGECVANKIKEAIAQFSLRPKSHNAPRPYAGAL